MQKIEIALVWVVKGPQCHRQHYRAHTTSSSTLTETICLVPRLRRLVYIKSATDGDSLLGCRNLEGSRSHRPNKLPMFFWFVSVIRRQLQSRIVADPIHTARRRRQRRDSFAASTSTSGGVNWSLRRTDGGAVVKHRPSRQLSARRRQVSHASPVNSGRQLHCPVPNSPSSHEPCPEHALFPRSPGHADNTSNTTSSCLRR